jgi:ribosomal protein S18 acetylase RimI-like enzyme
MTSASLTLTPLERRHYRAIDDLLFHSYQVHTHMDWYEPVEWLETHHVPVRLAWQGDRLAGVLAVSEPLNGASWLRVVAMHDHAPSHAVLAALWRDIQPDLRALNVQSVSLLMTRNWIKPHLRELDFEFIEDVITLQRTGRFLSDTPDHTLRVRSIRPNDLVRLSEIDQAAFRPPWQMTYEEIRQAEQIAEISTVVELDQQPVAFQISTLYNDGAHLARLAVDPQHQGQGIGSALLYDLLSRFAQRHVNSITVNTQASNLRSQRLYRGFGFVRNGYDLPVWSIQLPR